MSMNSKQIEKELHDKEEEVKLQDEMLVHDGEMIINLQKELQKRKEEVLIHETEIDRLKKLMEEEKATFKTFEQKTNEAFSREWKRMAFMADVIINAKDIITCLVDKNGTPDDLAKFNVKRADLKKRKADEEFKLSSGLEKDHKEIIEPFKKSLDSLLSMTIEMPTFDIMPQGEDMDHSLATNMTEILEKNLDQQISVDEKNIEQIIDKIISASYKDKNSVFTAFRTLSSSPLFKEFMQQKHAEDFVQSLSSRIGKLLNRDSAELEELESNDKALLATLHEQIEHSKTKTRTIIIELERIQNELTSAELELKVHEAINSQALNIKGEIEQKLRKLTQEIDSCTAIKGNQQLARNLLKTLTSGETTTSTKRVTTKVGDTTKELALFDSLENPSQQTQQTMTTTTTMTKRIVTRKTITIDEHGKETEVTEEVEEDAEPEVHANHEGGEIIDINENVIEYNSPELAALEKKLSQLNDAFLESEREIDNKEKELFEFKKVQLPPEAGKNRKKKRDRELLERETEIKDLVGKKDGIMTSQQTLESQISELKQKLRQNRANNVQQKVETVDIMTSPIKPILAESVIAGTYLQPASNSIEELSPSPRRMVSTDTIQEKLLVYLDRVTKYLSQLEIQLQERRLDHGNHQSSSELSRDDMLMSKAISSLLVQVTTMLKQISEMRELFSEEDLIELTNSFIELSSFVSTTTTQLQRSSMVTRAGQAGQYITREFNPVDDVPAKLTATSRYITKLAKKSAPGQIEGAEVNTLTAGKEGEMEEEQQEVTSEGQVVTGKRGGRTTTTVTRISSSRTEGVVGGGDDATLDETERDLISQGYVKMKDEDGSITWVKNTQIITTLQGENTTHTRDEILKREHPTLKVTRSSEDVIQEIEPSTQEQLTTRLRTHINTLQELLARQHSVEQDSNTINEELTRIRLDIEKITDNIAIHEDNLSKSIEQVNQIISKLQIKEEQKQNIERGLVLIKKLTSKLRSLDASAFDQLKPQDGEEDPSIAIERSAKELAEVFEALGSTTTEETICKTITETRTRLSTLLSSPGSKDQTAEVLKLFNILSEYLKNAKQIGQDIDFESVGYADEHVSGGEYEYKRFLTSLRSFLAKTSSSGQQQSPEIRNILILIRNAISKQIDQQRNPADSQLNPADTIIVPISVYRGREGGDLDDGQNVKEWVGKVFTYLSGAQEERIKGVSGLTEEIERLRSLLANRAESTKKDVQPLTSGTGQEANAPKETADLQQDEAENEKREESFRGFLQSLQMYLGTITQTKKPINPKISHILSMIKEAIDRKISLEGPSGEITTQDSPSQLKLNLKSGDEESQKPIPDEEIEGLTSPEKHSRKFLESLQLYLGTIQKKGRPLDIQVAKALSTVREAIDKHINPEGIIGTKEGGESPLFNLAKITTSIPPEEIEGQQTPKNPSVNPFLNKIQMLLGNLAETNLEPSASEMLDNIRKLLDNEIKILNQPHALPIQLFRAVKQLADKSKRTQPKLDPEGVDDKQLPIPDEVIEGTSPDFSPIPQHEQFNLTGNQSDIDSLISILSSVTSVDTLTNLLKAVKRRIELLDENSKPPVEETTAERLRRIVQDFEAVPESVALDKSVKDELAQRILSKMNKLGLEPTLVTPTPQEALSGNIEDLIAEPEVAHKKKDSHNSEDEGQNPLAKSTLSIAGEPTPLHNTKVLEKPSRFRSESDKHKRENIKDLIDEIQEIEHVRKIIGYGEKHRRKLDHDKGEEDDLEQMNERMKDIDANNNKKKGLISKISETIKSKQIEQGDGKEDDSRVIDDLQVLNFIDKKNKDNAVEEEFLQKIAKILADKRVGIKESEIVNPREDISSENEKQERIVSLLEVERMLNEYIENGREIGNETDKREERIEKAIIMVEKIRSKKGKQRKDELEDKRDETTGRKHQGKNHSGPVIDEDVEKVVDQVKSHEILKRIALLIAKKTGANPSVVSPPSDLEQTLSQLTDDGVILKLYKILEKKIDSKPPAEGEMQVDNEGVPADVHSALANVKDPGSLRRILKVVEQRIVQVDVKTPPTVEELKTFVEKVTDPAVVKELLKIVESRLTVVEKSAPVRKITVEDVKKYIVSELASSKEDQDKFLNELHELLDEYSKQPVESVPQKKKRKNKKDGNTEDTTTTAGQSVQPANADEQTNLTLADAPSIKDMLTSVEVNEDSKRILEELRQIINSRIPASISEVTPLADQTSPSKDSDGRIKEVEERLANVTNPDDIKRIINMLAKKIEHTHKDVKPQPEPHAKDHSGPVIDEDVEKAVDQVKSHEILKRIALLIAKKTGANPSVVSPPSDLEQTLSQLTDDGVILKLYKILEKKIDSKPPAEGEMQVDNEGVPADVHSALANVKDPGSLRRILKVVEQRIVQVDVKTPPTVEELKTFVEKVTDPAVVKELLKIVESRLTVVEKSAPVRKITVEDVKKYIVSELASSKEDQDKFLNELHELLDEYSKQPVESVPQKKKRKNKKDGNTEDTTTTAGQSVQPANADEQTNLTLADAPSIKDMLTSVEVNEDSKRILEELRQIINSRIPASISEVTPPADQTSPSKDSDGRIKEVEERLANVTNPDDIKRIINMLAKKIEHTHKDVKPQPEPHAKDHSGPVIDEDVEKAVDQVKSHEILKRIALLIAKKTGANPSVVSPPSDLEQTLSQLTDDGVILKLYKILEKKIDSKPPAEGEMQVDNEGVPADVHSALANVKDPGSLRRILKVVEQRIVQVDVKTPPTVEELKTFVEKVTDPAVVKELLKIVESRLTVVEKSAPVRKITVEDVKKYIVSELASSKEDQDKFLNELHELLDEYSKQPVESVPQKKKRKNKKDGNTEDTTTTAGQSVQPANADEQTNLTLAVAPSIKDMFTSVEVNEDSKRILEELRQIINSRIPASTSEVTPPADQTSPSKDSDGRIKEVEERLANVTNPDDIKRIINMLAKKIEHTHKDVKPQPEPHAKDHSGPVIDEDVEKAVDQVKSHEILKRIALLIAKKTGANPSVVSPPSDLEQTLSQLTDDGVILKLYKILEKKIDSKPPAEGEMQVDNEGVPADVHSALANVKDPGSLRRILKVVEQRIVQVDVKTPPTVEELKTFVEKVTDPAVVKELLKIVESRLTVVEKSAPVRKITVEDVKKYIVSELASSKEDQDKFLNELHELLDEYSKQPVESVPQKKKRKNKKDGNTEDTTTTAGQSVQPANADEQTNLTLADAPSIKDMLTSVEVNEDSKRILEELRQIINSRIPASISEVTPPADQTSPSKDSDGRIKEVEERLANVTNPDDIKRIINMLAKKIEHTHKDVKPQPEPHAKDHSGPVIDEDVEKAVDQVKSHEILKRIALLIAKKTGANPSVVSPPSDLEQTLSQLTDDGVILKLYKILEKKIDSKPPAEGEMQVDNEGVPADVHSALANVKDPGSLRRILKVVEQRIVQVDVKTPPTVEELKTFVEKVTDPAVVKELLKIVESRLTVVEKSAPVRKITVEDVKKYIVSELASSKEDQDKFLNELHELLDEYSKQPVESVPQKKKRKNKKDGNTEDTTTTAGQSVQPANADEQTNLTLAVAPSIKDMFTSVEVNEDSKRILEELRQIINSRIPASTSEVTPPADQTSPSKDSDGRIKEVEERLANVTNPDDIKRIINMLAKKIEHTHKDVKPQPEPHAKDHSGPVIDEDVEKAVDQVKSHEILKRIALLIAKKTGANPSVVSPPSDLEQTLSQLTDDGVILKLYKILEKKIDSKPPAEGEMQVDNEGVPADVHSALANVKDPGSLRRILKVVEQRIVQVDVKTPPTVEELKTFVEKVTDPAVVKELLKIVESRLTVVEKSAPVRKITVEDVKKYIVSELASSKEDQDKFLNELHELLDEYSKQPVESVPQKKKRKNKKDGNTEDTTTTAGQSVQPANADEQTNLTLADAPSIKDMLTSVEVNEDSKRILEELRQIINSRIPASISEVTPPADQTSPSKDSDGRIKEVEERLANVTNPDDIKRIINMLAKKIEHTHKDVKPQPEPHAKDHSGPVIDEDVEKAVDQVKSHEILKRIALLIAKKTGANPSVVSPPSDLEQTLSQLTDDGVILKLYKILEKKIDSKPPAEGEMQVDNEGVPADVHSALANVKDPGSLRRILKVVEQRIVQVDVKTPPTVEELKTFVEKVTDPAVVKELLKIVESRLTVVEKSAPVRKITVEDVKKYIVSELASSKEDQDKFLNELHELLDEYSKQPVESVPQKKKRKNKKDGNTEDTTTTAGQSVQPANADEQTNLTLADAPSIKDMLTSVEVNEDSKRILEELRQIINSRIPASTSEVTPPADQTSPSKDSDGRIKEVEERLANVTNPDDIKRIINMLAKKIEHTHKDVKPQPEPHAKDHSGPVIDEDVEKVVDQVKSHEILKRIALLIAKKTGANPSVVSPPSDLEQTLSQLTDDGVILKLYKILEKKIDSKPPAEGEMQVDNEGIPADVHSALANVKDPGSLRRILKVVEQRIVQVDVKTPPTVEELKTFVEKVTDPAVVKELLKIVESRLTVVEKSAPVRKITVEDVKKYIVSELASSKEDQDKFLNELHELLDEYSKQPVESAPQKKKRKNKKDGNTEDTTTTAGQSVQPANADEQTNLTLADAPSIKDMLTSVEVNEDSKRILEELRQIINSRIPASISEVTPPADQTSPSKDSDGRIKEVEERLANVTNPDDIKRIINMLAKKIEHTHKDVKPQPEPHAKDHSGPVIDEDVEKAVDQVKSHEILKRIALLIAKKTGANPSVSPSSDLEQTLSQLTDDGVILKLYKILEKKIDSKPPAEGEMQVDSEGVPADVHSALANVKDPGSLRRILKVVEQRIVQVDVKTPPTVEELKTFVEKVTDPAVVKELLKIVESRLTVVEKSAPVRKITIEDVKKYIVSELASSKEDQDKFLSTLLDTIILSRYSPTASQLSSLTLLCTSTPSPLVVPKTSLLSNSTTPSLKLHDITKYFLLMALPSGKSRPQLHSELTSLLRALFTEELQNPGGNSTVHTVLDLIREMFQSEDIAQYDRKIAERAREVKVLIDQSKISQTMIEFFKNRAQLADQVMNNMSTEHFKDGNYLKPEDIEVNLNFDSLSKLADHYVQEMHKISNSLNKVQQEQSNSLKELKEYVKTSGQNINPEQLGKLINTMSIAEGKLLGMRCMELNGLNNIITLIQNPRIDRWHSFLSYLDLRLKAASDHLKRALGVAAPGGSPTGKASQIGANLSQSQEEELRNNITRLENMIQRIALLAQMQINPGQVTHIQENLRSGVKPSIQPNTSEFQLTPQPARDLTMGSNWPVHQASVSPLEVDMTVPGRMGILLFNSTVLMLRGLDDIVCKVDAPDAFRETLAKLYAENLQNTRMFRHGRREHDWNKMLDACHKEKDTQNKIIEAVVGWDFNKCVECCYKSHLNGKDCGRICQ